MSERIPLICLLCASLFNRPTPSFPYWIFVSDMGHQGPHTSRGVSPAPILVTVKHPLHAPALQVIVPVTVYRGPTGFSRFTTENKPSPAVPPTFLQSVYSFQALLLEHYCHRRVGNAPLLILRGSLPRRQNINNSDAIRLRVIGNSIPLKNSFAS